MSEWCIAFTSGLAATLVGLAVGIPVALWVDRLVKKPAETRDKQDLLRILIDTIDLNFLKAGKVAMSVTRSTVVTLNMDLVVLEATSVKAYTLLSPTICAKLSAVRSKTLLSLLLSRR